MKSKQESRQSKEEYIRDFVNRFGVGSARKARTLVIVAGNVYDAINTCDCDFTHGELALARLRRHKGLADEVFSYLRAHHPMGYVRAEVERCSGKSEQEVGKYTGLAFAAA